MRPVISARDVEIVNFEETRIACLEHRGDPRLIGASVRKFIEWRKQAKLSPKTHATFDILYDDLGWVDICVATNRGAGENSYGIVDKTIPAGRCAVLRHIGSDDTLGESIGYLYATWLPASGEEPRDFPLFLQRVSFFPDVPEHEAVSDLFLPLR